MINTILDIIRLLNDGNIVPMQKDEDTKIDLYNKKVQLFMDASGEESKYYYFSELEIDDENQDSWLCRKSLRVFKKHLSGRKIENNAAREEHRNGTVYSQKQCSGGVSGMRKMF